MQTAATSITQTYSTTAKGRQLRCAKGRVKRKKGNKLRTAQMHQSPPLHYPVVFLRSVFSRLVVLYEGLSKSFQTESITK
jgi:hypothetical protein